MIIVLYTPSMLECTYKYTANIVSSMIGVGIMRDFHKEDLHKGTDGYSLVVRDILRNPLRQEDILLRYFWERKFGNQADLVHAVLYRLVTKTHPKSSFSSSLVNSIIAEMCRTPGLSKVLVMSRWIMRGHIYRMIVRKMLPENYFCKTMVAGAVRMLLLREGRQDEHSYFSLLPSELLNVVSEFLLF
jgi:hypothetical protein